jgi:cytidyltransferase-like protein
MAYQAKHTAIVFGVFDGLHEGHRFFLTQAKKLCEKLVVVLTPSETSKLLKGRSPHFSYEEREKELLKFDQSLEIVPADTEPGAWKIFRDRAFDRVILGYDQSGIAKELEKMSMPFIVLDAHRPETYKSSLLHH